ncbi:squalene synthase HpnC [Janthinobacterium psychrotolerans]|uniref:Squalene synthase HpnC n=1 Tax=Janthinobacterium psychrotolerans TaxID=1747903 RepID=A0A1A7C0I1_9BURK|nr:squalene synthase HpnC [Janthinobacterium psychrotolerans]OBV37833.1 squalene synthase HpnC [Janthinobacterium psychrotolerans]
MPVDHYENFPVASVLMPRRLVPAVEAIYAFARSADDLADEGDATPAERLAALQSYESALDRIAAHEPETDPMFVRLAATIAKFELPMQPFYDLLSAFKQDVRTTRYATHVDVLDYCARSANPVGLLMLSLYKAADEANVRDSNAICSALQLINFLQDVAIDRQKERIYLPMEDLNRFAVSPAAFERPEAHGKWSALMRFEVARTRALMLSGAPLALRLRGRIGWELRLVVQGGLRILEMIEAVNYDVFRRRPKLSRRDWLIILWRALRMSRKSVAAAAQENPLFPPSPTH